MYKILLLSLAILASCSNNESNKEMQLLKEQNELLKSQVDKHKTDKSKAERKRRNEELRSEKESVRNTLEGMINAIARKDYEHLRGLCCYECDTDTEVINLCQMENFRMGDRIGIRQLYRNATVMSVDVEGNRASGVIYLPSGKYKGTINLEKKDSKWLIVSM